MPLISLRQAMIGVRDRWSRPLAAAVRWRHRGGTALSGVAAACALTLCASSAFGQVQAKYLFSLSNFSGPLRYDLVRVRVDQERDEIYVIYQNLIRVFNPSGMEIFSFGDGIDLGQILDAALDRNGDVILLSHKDSRSIVTRCNFRGVPAGRIEITNLPAGVAFAANRMVLRNDLFYFVSLAASSVIVTDSNGEFRKHIELLPLLEAEDRQKGGAEAVGFAVDREGSIFLTVPALFKVYKVSPDGKAAFFGRPGSAAGRFGVLAGIATDSHGDLLVVDKLKCVVMVFDKDFNFLTEFGYRGGRPENLIVPDDIDVDRRDRLYVSQGRRRGVSVFALTRN
jgi:hypothetical protein